MMALTRDEFKRTVIKMLTTDESGEHSEDAGYCACNSCETRYDRCPLGRMCLRSEFLIDSFLDTIEIVEKWAKEHSD